mmetsp:Transcript_16738/g.38388  ORF Transcript_16738/g.38388 Transcript_16738/m.38388 type:complete len:230 (-) Transcript_16738:1326-2015(-)
MCASVKLSVTQCHYHVDKMFFTSQNDRQGPGTNPCPTVGCIASFRFVSHHFGGWSIGWSIGWLVGLFVYTSPMSPRSSSSKISCNSALAFFRAACCLRSCCALKSSNSASASVSSPLSWRYLMSPSNKARSQTDSMNSPWVRSWSTVPAMDREKNSRLAHSLAIFSTSSVRSSLGSTSSTFSSGRPPRSFILASSSWRRNSGSSHQASVNLTPSRQPGLISSYSSRASW